MSTPSSKLWGAPELLWAMGLAVALFAPLTKIMGYEFAFVVNLLVVVLGPWIVRRVPAGLPVWDLFWARCWRLVPHLGLSFVAGLLNMLRVRNCAPAEGIAYFLILGVGGVPLVVALTMVSERLCGRSARWRVRTWAAIYGAICVSLLSSAWWLATQPPLVVYDAFLGFFTASLYDEALVAPGHHLAFRAMTLAAALFWVAVLAWESQPTRARAGWALVLGALIFSSPLYKGPLNISRSRAFALEMLGGHIRTEHFEIFYDASSLREHDLVQLIADHESRYDELRAFWHVEPPLPLYSYIYSSREQRAAAMGSRSTMIARIWLRETHLVWGGPGDGLLAHELSHLFLYDAGRGPLRLASSSWGVPLMGLVEGAASAAAWEADELTEHGWAAAIDRLGLIESPASSLAAAGFWTEASGVVYTVAYR